MMDEADRAERYQREMIQRGLENRAKMPDLPYTGNCAWCSAPVGGRRRFCEGVECRDDWERDWNRRQ